MEKSADFTRSMMFKALNRYNLQFSQHKRGAIQPRRQTKFRAFSQCVLEHALPLTGRSQFKVFQTQIFHTYASGCSNLLA